MATASQLPEVKFSWLDVPRAIWKFLDKDKKRWVFLNVVLFSVFFYKLVPPYLLGKIIDFFTAYKMGDPLLPLYLYAAIIGTGNSTIALIRLGSKNALRKISIMAKTRARVMGFERLTDFSLHWHSQENSGNKVERIFTGSNAIPEWAGILGSNLYPHGVSLISVLAVFWVLDTSFAIFLMAYIVLFFGIEYVFNRRLAELAERINKARQEATGTFMESTGNMLAIKALGAEKGLRARVRDSEHVQEDLMIQRADLSTRKWYFFQILNGLAYGIFLIMIGHQVAEGTISIGKIFTFVTYFNQLADAKTEIAEVSTRVIELKSQLGSMMPIFQDEAGFKGVADFPKSWDAIRIEDGHFSYPAGQSALQDLTFELRHGEQLGVAGLSGSGKSTLVKMLLGLYRLEKGSFRIGDIDYYEIKHENIIKNVAVVLQETELFNLSLKDNVTVMRDIDPKLLEKALDISCLMEVVEKLPEGIHTLIGEKGYKLSGGERQRLGIARAICKDAPIMIFDEATSSLDSKTEKKIMDKLLTQLQGKTMLIVAHRLSTLKKADRVIVFEGGNIVEEGTFDGLTSDEDSQLGQLYKLQQRE